MKKYLPLFLLLLYANMATAQNDSIANYSYYSKRPPAAPKRNILKIAPFRLAASTMSISYERAFSPRSSFMITGLLTSATKETYSYTNYKVTAFGGGGDVEFRTYPLVEFVPMKGYFVGLYGSFNYTAFEYKENSTLSSGYPVPEDEYIARYGAGVLMGYQFIIKETIAFDVYAGGGIRKVETNIEDNYNGYYYNPYDILSSGISSGIYPRMGFNFGLCF